MLIKPRIEGDIVKINYMTAILVIAMTKSSSANTINIEKVQLSGNYYYASGTMTCGSYDYTNTHRYAVTLNCMVHPYYADGTDNMSMGHDITGSSTLSLYLCPGVTDVYNSGESGLSRPISCEFSRIPVALKDETDPDWYNNVRLCAATMEGNNSAGIANYSSDTILVEGCKPSPIPIDTIYCSTPSITIDYGIIRPSFFNGNKKSVNSYVSCVYGDASVKLYFSSPEINFNNGGKANLSFDEGGGVTETVIEGKENDKTSFTIYSKLLASKPVEMGDFSGSTTLIIDLQ
ncbi:MrpH family fimbial adhesin [Kluyvera intermedia]|uniref:MrpH family fimbial adhesin n=1 Tax=Kluyvera intermedia TaxID=61648 RepID=UPI003524ECD4